MRGSHLIVVNESLGRKAIMITARVSPGRRGSYGFDAPLAPAFITAMAVLYVVLAIISGTRKFWVSAAFILAIDALYIYTTRRGKFVAWAELLGRGRGSRNGGASSRPTRLRRVQGNRDLRPDKGSGANGAGKQSHEHSGAVFATKNSHG